MSNPPRTHTPAEIAELEASTGLQLVGYLATDAPVTLLPILGRAEITTEQRRRIVAALNRAGVQLLDPPQVEGRTAA